MPRQNELPHTAAPPGPCDRQRDAYAEALELAAEAAADKKRARDALLDKMLSTNTGRVPFVNAKGKRCWLTITAGEPKLRSEKAEAGEAQGGLDRQSRRGSEPAESGGSADGDTPGAKDRYGQPVEDAEQQDPFASTRAEIDSDDSAIGETAEAGGGLSDVRPDRDEETPAQASAREAETARAGRRKRGGR